MNRLEQDLPHLMAVVSPYVHPELEPGRSQNVIDRYKGMTAEAIKDDLDAFRGEMVTVCQNLTSDFNKATILRTHNAMAGKLLLFTERRKVNRVGTVGQHHYTHAGSIQSTEEAVEKLKLDGYTVWAVDNSEWMEPKPLQEVIFPAKTAFVYGEEGCGLSESVVSACDGSLFVPMAGSVRSLNVASCAAMVMYAYGLQHPFTPNA